MPPIELAKRLALLLVLAFFLGLAFEEVYKRDEPTIPGGIRTFPLVGLAGAMLYLVEPHWALAFVAGLLAMAAWLYAFLRFQRPPEGGSGRTLVIPVCNLLIYGSGGKAVHPLARPDDQHGCNGHPDSDPRGLRQGDRSEDVDEEIANRDHHRPAGPAFRGPLESKERV